MRAFDNFLSSGEYSNFHFRQSFSSFLSFAGSETRQSHLKQTQLGVKILALEFSSRETLNQIKNSGTWWETFHDAINKNISKARKMVKGKEAIVIGLIGFDNEHGSTTGARVELHPVWGLAIHTDDAAKDPKLAEDVWVILARNWGNEGSCSNGWDITHSAWLHDLSLHENKMKFFLPTSVGSSGTLVKNFHTNYGDGMTKGTATPVEGGILLTIQLPEPEDKKLFWGELHIRK